MGKIGAIIQARMSSQRFPGKVMHKVNGKPILQYLIDRLNHCSLLETIVIATSSEKSDLPIVEFCKENDVGYHRGSLLNVAERFKDILEIYQFDGFARVSGDSPLLDQRLIEKGLDIFLNNNYELVTNILSRSYPKGQSVEILDSDSFLFAFRMMKEDEDLEHVTKYFYKHAEDFRILNFESRKDMGSIQLSIDTQQDLMAFKKIISKMNRPHWEYTLEDILEIY
jgi:spore coat polysaccharide biosynthesis protein SpsF